MPENLQVDKLNNFYKMLDKSHTNVIKSTKRASSGKDWDILKFSKQKKSPTDARSTISNIRSTVPFEEMKIIEKSRH